MVTTPDRGQIWWGELEGVGRRPLLIMTRYAAIPVLNSVLAAPGTRTIRGISTELRVGVDDGMPTDCVASFDNLRVVPKAYLCRPDLRTLRPPRLAEAYAAVRAAIDCQAEPLREGLALPIDGPAI